MKQYRSEPLTEPEKRYLRKISGTRQRFAVDKPTSDKPKSEREFFCPTNITQTIARSKKRGFNGCKLSAAKRAAVIARQEARDAFFAGLK